MSSYVEEKDAVEEFADDRAKAIAEKLAKLSDEELESYQAFTSKKEIRIAKRLGLVVSEVDEENLDSSWRLFTLEPEELNAFHFTHIRWFAHLIEWMRRQPRNRSYYGGWEGCC